MRSVVIRGHLILTKEPTLRTTIATFAATTVRRIYSVWLVVTALVLCGTAYRNEFGSGVLVALGATITFTILTGAIAYHRVRGRAEAERTLRRREAELRGFITMASHDLKSPLSVISSHLQMLREDHGRTLGADGERGLAAMDRATRRIDRLVEGLLGHARAEASALRLAPVALDDMVADVVTERVTAGNGTRVVTDGPLPTLTADAVLLRHVIDNLVGNALKYAPAGTRPNVTVSARHLAGEVRIEVADRGIGIPEDERPRIFDEFHRCANSRGFQGTGLGLAICRRIVERHGGRIGVEENPGGGSRFWFTLP
ncbi:HAMP domain-containing sensor histidine kinase [Actinoplanes sp. NPDC049668]|uniref:sensor histidine kinase n=1 Tax=unclassified Actinoplanes TaxID=2626549 RepID=UPI0033B98BA3